MATGLMRLYEEQLGPLRGHPGLLPRCAVPVEGAAAWLDGRTTQARRWFGWHAPLRMASRMGSGRLGQLEVEGLPDSHDTLTRCMRTWRGTGIYRLCEYKDLGLRWEWNGRKCV